jgi:hypothetical protein
MNDEDIYKDVGGGCKNMKDALIASPERAARYKVCALCNVGMVIVLVWCHVIEHDLI